jgi:hypothetical protein
MTHYQHHLQQSLTLPTPCMTGLCWTLPYQHQSARDHTQPVQSLPSPHHTIPRITIAKLSGCPYTTRLGYIALYPNTTCRHGTQPYHHQALRDFTSPDHHTPSPILPAPIPRSDVWWGILLYPTTGQRVVLTHYYAFPVQITGFYVMEVFV